MNKWFKDYLICQWNNFLIYGPSFHFTTVLLRPTYEAIAFY